MSISSTYKNYSDQWHTPQIWLDWVARTFHGEPWFDPCPSDFNAETQRDGREIAWGLNTYVNYPGEKKHGAAQSWWKKYQIEQRAQFGRIRFIWCAFNQEQLRLMTPKPMSLPGWLIQPDDRTPFVWGGPDIPAKLGGKARKHGEVMKSPGNYAVFWTNCPPAEPPVAATVTRLN